MRCPFVLSHFSTEQNHPECVEKRRRQIRITACFGSCINGIILAHSADGGLLFRRQRITHARHKKVHSSRKIPSGNVPYFTPDEVSFVHGGRAVEKMHHHRARFPITVPAVIYHHSLTNATAIMVTSCRLLPA